jgi:hypothetical protein
MSFATYYGQDPWENIQTNQRVWYDPILRATYRASTIYTNMVPYATQPMLPNNARTMVFNFAFDYLPNTDPIGLRYTELGPVGLDGQQVEVTFERYGWETQYDKYDDLVSYWISQGNSQAGLRPLIAERTSRQMVETMDRLIRNAFLGTSYVNLVNASYSGADQMQSTDKYDLGIVDQAILRAQTQNVWTSPAPGLAPGALMCIGTPGQHYDILSSASNATNKWIELQKYASLKPYNQYEIGSYHSSRHLVTNGNVLWNCGPITTQTNITAVANALDGAPDPAITKVDGTYKVGQPSTAATHSITVASTVGFAVGDRVTIHKLKNQAADVTANPKLRVLGAPKYDEGVFLTRRIVSIPDSTHLVFNMPVMRAFATEIATTGTGVATGSSGCYGFVTKGLSLHINLIIAEPNGVVNALCVPPRVYAPAPIDTMQSVYRIGWDAYMKYQLVRPEAFEIWVTAGSAREKGPIYN